MVSKNKNSLVSPNSSARKGQKKNKQTTNKSKSMTFTTAQVPQYRAIDTGLRRLENRMKISRQRISPEGMSFLKCAFAPPDFQASSLGGVPDDFRGPSLTKKHRMTFPINMNASTDYYFILAPVPGIAFYWVGLPSSTTPGPTSYFTAVPYPDFTQMFGATANTTTQMVTKFRYVSNHIELIPTTNQTSWSGNIQAWKLPLAFITRPPSAEGSDRDLFSITGLDGIVSASQQSYVAPFNMGIFSGCYSSSPLFQFTPLTEDVLNGNVPEVIGPADWGQFGGSGTPFTGFDNGFESVVVKVSGISASLNDSAVLKTWSCVEYQVNPTSVLSSFVSLSPCDPYSLQLYREIICNLPIGVPYMENDGFWDRVMKIIDQVTTATSFIPGPIGALSQGINLTNKAIGGMF
jgi:hypothetical protein